jgi:hypothetical protein
LHAQSVAVAGYVRAWLNAEWALEALDAPHAEVATAAGDAYVAARAGGGDDADVGDVLLSVAAALAGHPALGPTYTDGFEVANKVRGGGRGRRSSWRVVRSTVADPRPCLRPPPAQVSELLVFATAGDACCVGEDDRARLAEWAAALREE